MQIKFRQIVKTQIQIQYRKQPNGKLTFKFFSY